MNTLIRTTLGLLIFSVSLAAVQAATEPSRQYTQPDYGKEQRWAEQIVDFLIDGEPVWLASDKRKFLGIYTEAMTDTTRGAVILVHGGGVHPDWQQVIKPLRLSLPSKGWATLSIQMPVLPNAAEDRDYVAMFKYVPTRIQAAVKFLQQQNIRNIVLAGHSMGATMASHYLAESQDKNIQAFIGIGMKGIKQPKKLSVLDNSVSLVRINVPVLDVYGSHTNQEVLGSVDRRAFSIRSVGTSGSRQVLIKGADHFFERFEKQLSEEVTNWLESVMRVSAASLIVR